MPWAFLGAEPGAVELWAGALVRGGSGFGLGRAVVAGFDEFGRRQGLFVVQVELPLDCTLLVFLAHAPVCPLQEAELGVRSAFDPVGCRGDVQPGVFAFEVGEERARLAEAFQEPVGLAEPVVRVPPGLVRPHPSRDHRGRAPVGPDVALDMDQAALHRGFGPALRQGRCEHPSHPKLRKLRYPEIRPPTLGGKPLPYTRFVL